MKTADSLKETWSIKIYTGNSPLQLKPTKGSLTPSITRHDITDIPASFVADPFMIKVNNTWNLFMEILNSKTGLGEIGLACSEDGINWNYQQVVLKESYHLSYPFVFENEGTYYMIPETLEAEAIRLYRATDFPYDWIFETNLTKGQYADPTLFQYNNIWWLFAASSPYKNNTLNLFYADQLNGPYTEHPASPLIENNIRRARPAGRIINYNNKLIRLCQDCYPKYGSSIRAFEITELTTTKYTEIELPESPVLKNNPIEKQWNSRGMHHMDAHQIEKNQWIACVDGCYNDAPIIKKRAVWIFDDSYKIPTFLSVASFRAHINIPITLLFYGNPEPEIVNAFQKLGGEIEIITKNNTNYSDNKRRDRHRINRLARMEVMRTWPEELVILFDGDLIFSEKIKELETSIDTGFKNIDKNRSMVWGVIEYDQKFYTLERDDYGNSKNTTKEELYQCLQDVQGENWKEKLSGLQYNNGLLVMYNCTTLADAWETNYRKGLDHHLINLEDDQLPLCAAMYELNTQTSGIDPAFNSLGKLSGDYIVYHAWLGRWKLELEKIITGGKNLEDYGRIAQQYYDSIPDSWIDKEEIKLNQSNLEVKQVKI